MKTYGRYKRLEIAKLFETVDPASPAYPGEEWQANVDAWQLIRDLLAGTQAMRAAGEIYCPQFRSEQAWPDDYAARIGLTSLYPGLERAIQQNLGRMFARAVTMKDDVPAQLRELFDQDIDGTGANLHRFLVGAVTKGLAYSSAYWMVDTPSADGKFRTRAEAVADGRRVFWRRYQPWSILERQYETVAGRRVLAVLRVAEAPAVTRKGWVRAERPKVRVWFAPVFSGDATRAGYEDYLLDDDRRWVLSAPRSLTDWEEIPMVRAPFEREPTSEEDCPFFANLAYENAYDWDAVSVLRAVNRKANNLVPVFAGVTEAPTWGDGAIVLQAQGATATMLEHQGHCIGSLRDAITEARETMRYLGMEPLMRKTGTPTATEESIRAAEAESVLNMWLKTLKDSIEYALNLSARAAGLGDKGGSVEMQQRYIPTERESSFLENNRWMYENALLSGRSLFNEAKRVGGLSDDSDFDEEQKAIGLELPARAARAEQFIQPKEDKVEPEPEE